MNDFTLEQKKRAVIEFSALEKELDQVLFASDDDDDDDNRFPWLKAGAAAGAATGAGYGIGQLVKKGRGINTKPAAFPVYGPGTPGYRILPGESKGLIGDLKTGAGAAAGEVKESVSAMFKRLFPKFAKAAV